MATTNGRPVRVQPAPGTRFTLKIRPPVRILTMNKPGHWAEIAAWRAAACIAATREHLPKGIERARADVVVHPTTKRSRRDRLNFRATTKPIIDGLGPATPHYETRYGRRVQVGNSPGHGFLVDDSDDHLDGEHITIGEPVPAANRAVLGGLVVVHLTVLPPPGDDTPEAPCGCAFARIGMFGHRDECPGGVVR